MALETLVDVFMVDGFPVCQLKSTAAEKPEEYVIVNHELNSLSFTLQRGPVQENGENGCQVDTIIAASLKILQGLNEKFPCRENSLAITKLQESLSWLQIRKTDRKTRGVEGTNQK